MLEILTMSRVTPIGILFLRSVSHTRFCSQMGPLGVSCWNDRNWDVFAIASRKCS